MLDRRQFYINGAWVAPLQANDFAVLNPSTEEAYATISLGSAADADRAVTAAKSTFKTWSKSTKQERVELLERILEVYIDRSDEMGDTISNEMGAAIA